MRSRRYAGALGMALLVVLGAMALGAGGAQAQLPGESKLGTYLINLGSALLAAVVGQSGLGSLLIPGRNVKLECHQGHAESAKVDSSTDALGKVTFLECVTLALDSGNPLPCETVGLGTISATYLALPISHAGEAFVLFEPQGTAFTTISYKDGTECPMPLNNPMSGAVSALVDKLDAVQQLLLFSPEIQLLTGDVLRWGGFPVYIHGDATVELVGEHLGQKLGVHGSHSAHALELHEHDLSLYKEELTTLHNEELGELEEFGTYLVNLGEALLAAVVGESGLGSLLIAGRNLKLECHQGHAESVKVDSSTDALGKVTFLQCVSLALDSGNPLPCETVGLGTISATYLALPISHAGEPFVLFEPQEGTNFTTISYKEGTECPMPLNNPITGAVSALVDKLDAAQQLLLFSPEIQLLTGDVLRFGGFLSYIHGDATVELAGAHEGQKLGIH